MSFWKFRFAALSGSSIDSLLNALPPTSSSPPTSSEISLFDSTLDSLLATPDLLSEIKSGTNQKLRDFLAREHVVQRLGGWIVWGLGGEAQEELELTEGKSGVGLIDDDVEDGKVPDELVVGVTTGSKKKNKLGMGRIIRRRDMNLYGILEGGTEPTEEEKAQFGHPRLATEILSSDIPGLTDILYNHTAASSQPETCPLPPSFLIPFWETILRSTEVQLETRSIQVGYWARVNSVLLNGPKGNEVLTEIFTIPHLLPRLLALLPICSPINDLLLLFLRITKTSSPLTTSLVPHTLRMLDPLAVLGIEGHVAAEELLRGIIELCSAAAPPLPPPPLSNGISEMPPAHLTESGSEWRENGLARQIASERSIQMLVDWILAGTEKEGEFSTEDDDDDIGHTPKIGKVNLPKSERLKHPLDELRTSSLIQSISVLIDLIRKNNSDFVEQQMLAWARKKEVEEREKLLEDEVVHGVDNVEEREIVVDTDKGPSLVDLGPLLRIIAGRLGGFQELILTPRTSSDPISTTAGIITPLTLERFRICEFYAELLHCSNMSLVNRPQSLAKLYDADGFLVDGWKAADEVSDALSGIQHEDEDKNSRMPSSPGQASISTYDTPSNSSPVEIPLSYSSSSISDLSSPSGENSLDSESGILTRAEVKELNALVAKSAIDETTVGDEDPFGDPVEGDSSSELINVEEEDEFIPPHNEQNGFIHSSTQDYIPAGLLLKSVFMEYHVIETVLDMFFDFPWNNFLHNVVFDIIQQVFHGNIERALDRQLVLSVFLDGKVIDRILDGQRENDIACAKPYGTRLGYMGHMSLIAEEIVKLFHHYPSEIYSIVEPHIPQPGWDQYVTTTLKETRERDFAPLGGGISNVNHETTSTASGSGSGLSDEDDEFPTSNGNGSGRVGKAVEFVSSPTNSPPREEASFGSHSKNGKNLENEIGSTSDKFSRYLANAISSDRPDKFGSSDEEDDMIEEDDAGWLGGTRFDPGDIDFALSESNSTITNNNNTNGKKSTGPIQFGFEDRFDEISNGNSQAFRDASPDSDDDAWGPYSADTDSPSKPKTINSNLNTFSNDDDFKPTVHSTSVNFESSFTDFGSDNFGSSGAVTNSNLNSFPDDFNSAFDSFPTSTAVDGLGAEEDDDFGDFETGSTVIENDMVSGSIITLPPITSTDVLSDFDFEEASRDINQPITSFSNFDSSFPSSFESSFADFNPIPSTTTSITTSDSNPNPNEKFISIFGKKRPSFERTITADDGSNLFGGLTLDESQFLDSEEVDKKVEQVGGMEEERKIGADKATSVEMPLGPTMHEGSHLVELGDGSVVVEIEIEGKTVRAPADDIALAHFRSGSN